MMKIITRMVPEHGIELEGVLHPYRRSQLRKELRRLTIEIRNAPMIKMIISGAVLALAAITAAGCGGHPAAPRQHTPSSPASNPASSPAAPPAAAAPSPDGTYQGSCDYALNAPDAPDQLVGEVDETNTGNIGLVMNVSISWPQEGYPPVTATRTVRVGYGATQAVRFHLQASQNVIDLLQSWQSGHDLQDGCTYSSDVTGTYGPVHQ